MNNFILTKLDKYELPTYLSVMQAVYSYQSQLPLPLIPQKYISASYKFQSAMSRPRGIFRKRQGVEPDKVSGSLTLLVTGYTNQ